MKQVTSIVLLASFLSFIIGPVPTAYAAPLTGLSDTMSSLKISTASDHEIVFTTPSGAGIGDEITLTFSGGFSLVGVDDNDIEVSSVADGAVDTTDVVAGNVITLTMVDAISAGTAVTIDIGTETGGGAQITNPATDGSHTITIGGDFGDTGVITVTILDDDQVAVTAEVGQSVTFSISNNTIAFGTLSASGPRYATTGTGSPTETEAHTLSAGTNASSGYTITVAGPTLTAANTIDTITAIGGTAAAPATGSEQFGMRLEVSSGSGIVSSPYGTIGQFAYDGHTAADIVASTPGSSATTVYSARYVASIDAQTEAGNYSTALTYVATANF